EAKVEVEFTGEGENEQAKVTAVGDPSINLKKGDVVVEVDKRYFRPTEVDLLIGDATKARTKLGWKPAHSLQDLVSEMVKADIEHFKKDVILKEQGYQTIRQLEGWISKAGYMWPATGEWWARQLFAISRQQDILKSLSVHRRNSICEISLP